MTDAPQEATDFDAIADLLWAPAKPRTRGPKPAQSAASVTDTAIAIADREGLGAVTMQRLATALGFTKMAIYRYVPSRTALVAAMADLALGPAPEFKASDWRSGLGEWALAAYNGFVAHPWLLEATMGPRVIGPNEAGWTEAGLVLLAKTSLSGADRLDVLAATIGHARAMAEQVVSISGIAATGRSPEALFSAGVKRDPGRFPEFARAVADVERNGGADNGLSFGLDCIFDGVALRLRKRT